MGLGASAIIGSDIPIPCPLISWVGAVPFLGGPGYLHLVKRKKAKLEFDELLEHGQRHGQRGELAQAESCYRHALAAAPDHPVPMTLLGLTLVDLGRLGAAIDVLEHARDVAPNFSPVQLALGSAYSAAGEDALAVTAMETALQLDSASAIPLERLAKHHLRNGRNQEAIGYLRRVLRRDPNHAQARYLLAGLSGDKTDMVDQPPPALIAELFDVYSTTFEEHLTDKLKYDVPAHLARLVAACGANPDQSLEVLDLGCGTGLAGAVMRPYASRLIGSDLSPRMILRAKQRGIYDELHVEDLLATLGRAHNVDLVVAADVLIYVGALEATFAGCAAALRTGGLFAFSIERSQAGDFELLTTLRYAHAPAYIERLAAAHEFAIAHAEPSVLRMDNDRPIDGVLYVLRR